MTSLRWGAGRTGCGFWQGRFWLSGQLMNGVRTAGDGSVRASCGQFPPCCCVAFYVSFHSSCVSHVCWGDHTAPPPPSATGLDGGRCWFCETRLKGNSLQGIRGSRGWTANKLTFRINVLRLPESLLFTCPTTDLLRSWGQMDCQTALWWNLFAVPWSVQPTLDMWRELWGCFLHHLNIFPAFDTKKKKIPML